MRPRALCFDSDNHQIAWWEGFQTFFFVVVVINSTLDHPQVEGNCRDIVIFPGQPIDARMLTLEC